MGKKEKKKKSHKSKDHKSKKKESKSTRDRSESSSSRDSSPDDKEDAKPKTAKETLNDFFSKSSNTKYMLAQKSEMLLFGGDLKREQEEKITESFTWRKKNQKIGLDKLEPEQMLMVNKQQQLEASRELEKLNKRKIERAREKEEQERERDFLQRQKESDYHKEWEKQEDSFHLQQVKLRSKIRIEEGRAKPIDLLAKYITSEEDDESAVEMHEPYTYLNGLTIRDLEDLLVDIKVYADLEMGNNADYWKDITIVTDDELKKLHRLDKNSREHAGDRREGINQSVQQDLSVMFRAKKYDELIELEVQIKKKINEESGIDIGYWESLLAQLKAHMARARLKDRHERVLNEKLQYLRRQQGISSSSRSSSSDPHSAMDRKIEDRIRKEEDSYRSKQDDRSKKGSRSHNTIDEEDEDEFDLEGMKIAQAEESQIDQITRCLSEYEKDKEKRGYSPVLMFAEDLPSDTFMITQEEDNKRLEIRRNQVRGTGSVRPDAEEDFEKKARDTMDMEILGNEMIEGDEVVTSKPNDIVSNNKGGGGGGKSNTIEIPVEHQYLWSDKYRPRKPRYYNRVHTGYDWNQYNKKHYDSDNPPPKTVQGYKFNIFYPDMIDKTKTPRYSITPCSDNKDFGTLRFHAGAPYEDVAFKIVSREWDISHRHGFRNQFQNGIYQLWFHFRKWKYRR